MKTKKRLISLPAFTLTFVIVLCSSSFFLSKANATTKAEDVAENATIILLQVGNPILSVNGLERQIDGKNTVPVIQNENTMLPVRAVVEAMNGTVNWDGTEQSVVLTHDSDVIKLTIGSNTGYINDKGQALATAPVIINGVTMLPIRFIAESFGYGVVWENQSKTVTIKSSLSQMAADSGNPVLPEVGNDNILVVYFSMPETSNANNMTQEEDNSVVVIDGEVLGNTQYVAQLIQEKTGSDIFLIKPQIPYTTNHEALVDLAKKEQEDNARPELAATVDNLEQYDVIFLGYPNWWGDMPMVLYTFLESHDLSGKTIIPFNTHGGSGFAGTIHTIAELQPNAILEQNGFTVSRDSVDECEDDVFTWLQELNLTQ